MMRLLYSTLTDCYVREDDRDFVIDKGQVPNEDCIYGIARYEGMYVFAKRQGENPEDPTLLLFLDKTMALCNKLTIAACQGAHQIISYGPYILTTASVSNEIVLTDVQNGKHEKIKIDFGIPGGKAQDVNHINSMCIWEEGLYVYCHNHGPSFIAVLDLPRLLAGEIKIWRIYRDVGDRGHNVLVRGNDMFSLSSGTGQMVCQKRDTGEVYRKIDLEGRYLRGLVEYKDHFYVGGSHRGKRNERSWPRQIAIFKISCDTLEVVDAIKIEERANILDILIED